MVSQQVRADGVEARAGLEVELRILDYLDRHIVGGGREAAEIAKFRGAASGVAVEPGFEGLEPFTPIDVTVIQPGGAAGATAVQPEFSGVVKQACGLVEVTEAVRVDAGGGNRHPET